MLQELLKQFVGWNVLFRNYLIGIYQTIPLFNYQNCVNSNECLEVKMAIDFHNKINAKDSYMIQNEA